jgi:hypothetical protein
MEKLLSGVSILDIISVIGVVVAIFLSLRKAPKELVSMDAEASESYANAAIKFADEIRKLKCDYDTLKTSYDEINKLLATQNERIEALETENLRLQVYVKRLCQQIRKSGGTPVEMDK